MSGAWVDMEEIIRRTPFSEVAVKVGDRVECTYGERTSYKVTAHGDQPWQVIMVDRGGVSVLFDWRHLRSSILCGMYRVYRQVVIPGSEVLGECACGGQVVEVPATVMVEAGGISVRLDQSDVGCTGCGHDWQPK